MNVNPGRENRLARRLEPDRLLDRELMLRIKRELSAGRRPCTCRP